MNILVTGDPSYNDWKEFKYNLEKNIIDMQAHYFVPAKDIRVLSNLKMTEAWCRKNNITCSPYDNDISKVDSVIVFNSGLKKINERITEAEKNGIKVWEVKIVIN